MIKSKFHISFIYKVLSVIFNLITTYLLLKIYTQSQYGILLTINSLVGLIVFFDFGINHGVKNLITVSFSTNDYLRTSKIISSSYLVLFSISVLIISAYLIITNNYIQFQKYALNKSLNHINKSIFLNILLISIIGFYFVSNFIHILLQSLNNFHYSNGINLIIQFTLLLITYINLNLWKLNYVYMAFFMTIIPIIINLLTTFIYFYLKKDIRPNFLLLDFKIIKLVLLSGFNFIFIQFGTIILFQTNSLLIITFLGSKFVSEYDIVYKIFSTILTVFNIYISPFWSQIAFFNSKNDMQSLFELKKNIQKKIIYFTCATICLIPFCKYLIKILISDSIIIHFDVVFAMSIYTISYIFQSSNSHVLNGLGKIKIQAALLIISGLLNIPLIYYSSKFIGLSGVIYANSFFLIFNGFYYKNQINKLIY